jgi:hypothetical protein
MKKKQFSFILVLLAFLTLSAGCDKNKSPGTAKVNDSNKPNSLSESIQADNSGITTNTTTNSSSSQRVGPNGDTIVESVTTVTTVTSIPPIPKPPQPIKEYTVAVGGTIIVSKDLSKWEKALKTGTTNFLIGITWGNGIYVAVGAGGTIVTSTDAYNWVPQSSGITTELKNVCFCNGVFFAMGNNGVALRSTDAKTWERIKIDDNVQFCGIAYGHGLFVAIGNLRTNNKGKIYTSPDGYNWSPLPKDPSFTMVQSIVLGKGTFVIGLGDANVGEGKSNRVLCSYDGINWNYRTVGNDSDSYATTYVGYGAGVTGNGIFMTSSGYTSVDAITWILRINNQKTTYAITYDKGYFCLVYGTKILITKDDGVTWLEHQSPAPDKLLVAVY